MKPSNNASAPATSSLETANARPTTAESPFGFVSMHDLEALCAQHEREVAYLVERRKKSLVLHRTMENLHEYEIAYNRMNTAPKVLDWIRHLTEKDWITTRHIHAFVEAAIDLGAKVHIGA